MNTIHGSHAMPTGSQRGQPIGILANHEQLVFPPLSVAHAELTTLNLTVLEFYPTHYTLTNSIYI